MQRSADTNADLRTVVVVLASIYQGVVDSHTQEGACLVCVNSTDAYQVERWLSMSGNELNDVVRDKMRRSV